MRVIIEQRHTIGTVYMSCNDCALARAIREQHPNFELCMVGGTSISDRKYKDFPFQEASGGWNSSTFSKINNGELDKFVLDIPVPYYDAKYPQQEPKPTTKEIIRYVSVPTSINEQTKQLILS